MCAHFCYKMVHCGIWDWCIVHLCSRSVLLQCIKNCVRTDHLMMRSVSNNWVRPVGLDQLRQNTIALVPELCLSPLIIRLFSKQEQSIYMKKKHDIPGTCFNINMYKNFNYEEKTVLRPPYFTMWSKVTWTRDRVMYRWNGQMGQQINIGSGYGLSPVGCRAITNQCRLIHHLD